MSVCLVRLAFTLWALGRADEADRLRQMAFDRAESLRHRYTQAYVRTFAAWNAVEAGLDEEAARLADGFRTDGWSSGNEVFAAFLFPGWAAVERGDVGAGIRLLEEAGSASRAIGHRLFEPLALLLLARAHDAAGDPASGLRAATIARTISEREMQFHEAESYRVSGELLHRAGGGPADVEACSATP